MDSKKNLLTNKTKSCMFVVVKATTLNVAQA